MTSKLADVEPGDEMYVLNSRMNSAFEANIVKVQDGVILAEVPSKGVDYKFSWETGEALDGGSILVEPDDWRARLILDRKDHAHMHEKLIRAATAFRKNPDLDHSSDLETAVGEWITFVASIEDAAALTANSIQEYLQNTGRDWREELGQ